MFEAERTSPDWTRWRPSAPTSAHWYNAETLQRLIGAEVAYAEDHGLPQRPVRDFIADFRGLSSTAKTKAICDGLEPQPPLPGRRGDRSGAGRRFAGRHEGGRAPGEAEGPRNHRPRASSQRFIAAGAQEDSFDYQMNAFEHDGLPYVVEVAFAYAPGLADKSAKRKTKTT